MGNVKLQKWTEYIYIYDTQKLFKTSKIWRSIPKKKEYAIINAVRNNFSSLRSILNFIFDKYSTREPIVYQTRDFDELFSEFFSYFSKSRDLDSIDFFNCNQL